MEKINGAKDRFIPREGWRRSAAYLRLMDLLGTYWLDNPSEHFVGIKLAFISADGQHRDASLWWKHPGGETHVSPEAILQKKRYSERMWEMPGGLGEWTAEEKKLFYMRLKQVKRQFYQDITKEIRERRQKNDARQV